MRPNYIPPTQAPSGPTKVWRTSLGARSEMNCMGDGVTSIEWRRADGRRLPSDARTYGGRLMIDNVAYIDEGIYECVLYDNYGRSSVLRAQLVVERGSFVNQRESDHRSGIPFGGFQTPFRSGGGGGFRGFGSSLGGTGGSGYDTGYQSNDGGQTWERESFYSECIGNGCP